MPIYEFYCPDNHHIYQFFARSLALGEKTPQCPENPGFRMERRVSRFALLKGVKEASADDPFADVEEDKMEAFMADMERSMAGMDENNPDPRQLGHFMRKMTDMMGDKTPPEMQELVRRLEAGEDPEKLEEKFGGLEEGGDDIFAQTVKKLRAGLRPPERDPKLYEMSEYLPAVE